MCRLLLLLYLAAGGYCRVPSFTVPEATLEFLSPKGLNISIPDTDPEVSLVAFHVNINEQFYGVEHGQWAQDVHKKRGGRWVMIIKDFKVQRGDTVHYWVYVIRDGLGYQNLDRSYNVTQENPHDVVTVTTAAPAVADSDENSTQVLLESQPMSTSGQLDSEQNSTQVLLQSQPTCTSGLLLNATFLEDSDLDQWAHDVHIGGSDLEDEFTVFSSNKGTSRVSEGRLVIRPSLLEDQFSEDFVATGNLTMNGCTANDDGLCSAQASDYLILPPAVSARLTTRQSFRLRNSTITIRAKLPSGDWIVPELRLTAAGDDHTPTSRVVLALTRGNLELTLQGSTLGSDLLEAGLTRNSSHRLSFQRLLNGSWADRYHELKLVWTQDDVEFLVDGELLGRLDHTTAVGAFDKQFHITVGVHVGGLRDFPDLAVSGGKPKPWKNSDPKARLMFWEARDQWHRSWGPDAALFVESVSVTQSC